MPEPNLPPLRLHLDCNLENKNNLVDVPFLKGQLPELPAESRRKLIENHAVPRELVLVIVVSTFFDILDLRFRQS